MEKRGDTSRVIVPEKAATAEAGFRHCVKRAIAALCRDAAFFIQEFMVTTSVFPYGPLRIVQVVNVRWFNATVWYGLFLARLLRGAGHEVRVLGLDGTESFARAEAWGLTPEALPLNTANPLALPGLYSRLRRLILDWKPHVVNCHRGEGFALWALLRRNHPRFALVRTRGDQRPPKGGMVNTAIHAVIADAAIATCSGIATAMRDIVRVPAERVHTICGGVDTTRFFPDPAGREAFRAAWGLKPEHLAVGLVGRFDGVKGQRELIRAFARLLENTENRDRPRLVLAGFPTTTVGEDAVRGWIREAGLEDKVILPGRREDVRGLMSALDLGVVASLGSETIARVALEIMACGVPLVGTRVGVMPDLLRGEALVPPGDVGALAGILERFAVDADFGPALRRDQAERMRSLGEKDFLEQTLAVYRQAMVRAGVMAG